MKFKPVSPARSSAPYTRPFSQTHAQHIFTLPSRSLEACTTSLSHFHRAFFQEIRLISFFLGSQSLSLCCGWMQAAPWLCVSESHWDCCRSAGGQAYYNQLKSHPCLVKSVQTCIIQQRAKGKCLFHCL